ncbi:MAG: hypothetical protein IKX21_01535 [Deltaproteobacteria bacterium]|nr:hypothetical protein [Deltaproteobacteria bacterium]
MDAKDNGGLTLAELLETDARTLRERQFQAMKKHVTDKLRRMAALVERDDFHSIGKNTFFSPAGDGYGCDNHVIDFGIPELGENWAHLDIIEACEKLVELKTGHAVGDLRQTFGLANAR